MFNNMTNSRIEEASEDDLLLAMGNDATSGKNKNKNKNTDTAADENSDDDSDDDSEKSTKGKIKKADKANGSKSKDTSASAKQISVLSKNDLDAAADDDNDDDNPDDDEPEEDEDEETKKADKKKADVKKKVKKDVDDSDDSDEDDEPEEDTDDDDDKDDKDEDKDEDADDDDSGLNVGSFLKARVDLLIKKGSWIDFDGREDVEWDEDTFADMEVQQQEYKEAELREKILNKFGPYGQQIATFTENGGDPDELITIFQEQQKVENLSVDTESQQKTVMTKYATEYLKMKPEKAAKYIDTLIADKELESEAKEAKDTMEADLKKQAVKLQKEQEDYVKEQSRKTQQNIAKFAQDVTTELSRRKDIPESERKEIIRLLTKHDKKLPNGSPANEFYFKLSDFRKNISDYIDLVRFVTDKNKFMKTLKNDGKSEANEKAFKLLRTDNKRKAAKATSTAGSEGNEKPVKKSTFRLL